MLSRKDTNMFDAFCLCLFSSWNQGLTCTHFNYSTHTHIRIFICISTCLPVHTLQLFDLMSQWVFIFYHFYYCFSLSLSLRRKRRGDSIQCFELRRKKKINIWIKMGFCFSVRLKIESSRCYNFYIFVMNFYMFV